MRISSVQRRFQRYRIIYLWKVVAGLTHNFGISWRYDDHKGLMININQLKYHSISNNVLNIWKQLLGVNGAMLFNSLPYKVRNYGGKSISGFKMTLDQVLETIPDCPPSIGLYPLPINTESMKNSNCIIDWCKYLKISQRREIEMNDVIL